MKGTLKTSSKANSADMDIFGLILFHRALKASTPRRSAEDARFPIHAAAVPRARNHSGYALFITSVRPMPVIILESCFSPVKWSKMVKK